MSIWPYRTIYECMLYISGAVQVQNLSSTDNQEFASCFNGDLSYLLLNELYIRRVISVTCLLQCQLKLAGET